MPQLVRTDPVEPQTPAKAGGESPLSLGASQWRQALKSTRGEIKADRAGLVSAGVAFYWFLAVFPALIAAIGLLDVVNAGPAALSAITDAIRSALPSDAAKVLVEAVSDAGSQRESASAAAAIGGILAALWSASAGMIALQTGLDIAYDVDSERKFLKKRAVAFLLIAAAALLGGASLTAASLGRPIDEWAAGLAGGVGIVLLVHVVRWAVTLFGLTTLVAVFYYFGPNRDSPDWKWLTPGGAVATIGAVAASFGFGLYVSMTGSYAQTYGSLAGVVVLVLWLYITALVILVGAELNAELERQNQIRKVGGEASERKRRGGVARRIVAGLVLLVLFVRSRRKAAV